MKDLRFLHSTFADDVAFAFHEAWRKTRLREDGSYEPRWKAIKDQEFINDLDEKLLPPYIRKNEAGAFEIDIANAYYNQLSGDWQAENKAAAEVVAQIISSGKKYSTKQIGSIIHDAWLERNTYAKGGELDVPFKKLSKEEQQKDLVQYEIAVKMKEARLNGHPTGNSRDDMWDRDFYEPLEFAKKLGLNETVSWYFGNDEYLYIYALFDDDNTMQAKEYGMDKKQMEYYNAKKAELERENANYNEEDVNQTEEVEKEIAENVEEEKTEEQEELEKLVDACKKTGLTNEQTKTLLHNLGYEEYKTSEEGDELIEE